MKIKLGGELVAGESAVLTLEDREVLNAKGEYVSDDDDQPAVLVHRARADERERERVRAAALADIKYSGVRALEEGEAGLLAKYDDYEDDDATAAGRDRSRKRKRKKLDDDDDDDDDDGSGEIQSIKGEIDCPQRDISADKPLAEAANKDQYILVLTVNPKHGNCFLFLTSGTYCSIGQSKITNKP